MKQLITYGSQYGTTKTYAKKLSQATGINIENYKNINNIEHIDLLIHLGGLYAGGVKGLKEIVKHLPSHTKLIIITVGLADVNNIETTNHIQNSIKAQISDHILNRTKIFYLRGGIDYQKLSLKHKTMMKLLYLKSKNIPQEKQTPETKMFIETYGQKINFIDLTTLDPIIKEITSITKQ